MKCPHCGNELKEGYLICEKCGEEIRIVPDFEPEIENSITETLSTLASMQEGKDTEEVPAVDQTQTELFTESEDMAGSGVKKIWITLVLVLLFVIAFISYGLYSYHVQTIDFQLNKARTYADRGAYREAVDCLEEASGSGGDSFPGSGLLLSAGR